MNVQPIEDIKEKFEGVKEYVVFAIAVVTVISFIGKRINPEADKESTDSNTISKDPAP